MAKAEVTSQLLRVPVKNIVTPFISKYLQLSFTAYKTGGKNLRTAEFHAAGASGLSGV